MFSYFTNLHFKPSNRTKYDSYTKKKQIAINDQIIYNSQACIVFNLHRESTQVKTACEWELEPLILTLIQSLRIIGTSYEK